MRFAKPALGFETEEDHLQFLPGIYALRVPASLRTSSSREGLELLNYKTFSEDKPQRTLQKRTF